MFKLLLKISIKMKTMWTFFFNVFTHFSFSFYFLHFIFSWFRRSNYWVYFIYLFWIFQNTITIFKIRKYQKQTWFIWYWFHVNLFIRWWKIKKVQQNNANIFCNVFFFLYSHSSFYVSFFSKFCCSIYWVCFIYFIWIF